ncbi:hypothetical protein LCGC14_1614380 [marine sediment metagenome]|uniref:Uncharacterized protein n=1 Tax=marine sediment metagenome TaxID=412755 RepID=A0A0F9KN22_9ZZZZ
MGKLTYAIASVLDVLSTWLGLDRGIAHEANPPHGWHSLFDTEDAGNESDRLSSHCWTNGGMVAR